MIPLHGVMHDVFVSLLEYIYTGKITCSPATSVDLLKCEYSLYNTQALPCFSIPYSTSNNIYHCAVSTRKHCYSGTPLICEPLKCPVYWRGVLISGVYLY